VNRGSTLPGAELPLTIGRNGYRELAATGDSRPSAEIGLIKSVASKQPLTNREQWSFVHSWQSNAKPFGNP